MKESVRGEPSLCFVFLCRPNHPSAIIFHYIILLYVVVVCGVVMKFFVVVSVI